MEESLNPQLVESLSSLWRQLELFFYNLLSPWQLYQVAIIGVILLVAQGLKWWLQPRLTDWVRQQQGWERWRLELFIIANKRLRSFLFILVAWLVVMVMREVTWPSRSNLIALAASLATAWLLIKLLGHLIRNPLMRRFVTWGAWIYITLRYLGFDRSVGEFLDSLAIDIGGLHFSLLTLLQGLLVTGTLIMLARFLSRIITSQVAKNQDISPSIRVLIGKLSQLAFYGLALYLGLKAIGFDLTGLAVFSGAVGLGVGFGLQKVVSNLISGIIILLDKSVKPGDVISIGNTFGWIDALGARYVSVVTRDGKEYLIPNEDLITGQVVNWSHSNEFVRLDIHFGTSYDDDPHVVRQLAITAALSVDRVLQTRKPVCHITGFGESSIDYILRFWINDATQGLTNVRGAVFLALWDSFKQHQISIPFPQREVKVVHSQLSDKELAAIGGAD